MNIFAVYSEPLEESLNSSWKKAIMLSAPSPPYLLTLTNFTARNLSNAWLLSISRAIARLVSASTAS